MTIYKSILILFPAFIYMSCANQYQKGQPIQNVDTVVVDQKNLELSDYLRRIPSLYIVKTGGDTEVYLRENSTISGRRQVLFVIDGLKVGHDYQRVARIVDPNDIESVRALTNVSETSAYGIDGNSGVVLIKTKNK